MKDLQATAAKALMMATSAKRCSNSTVRVRRDDLEALARAVTAIPALETTFFNLSVCVARLERQRQSA